VLRLIENLEENIIALLLVSMTLLVFLEVVLRFGFGTGYMWSQELTLHMSAWFVLFGASYGLKVGAHIGVDAFVNLLPPTPRRLLSALAVVLSLVYCSLFLIGSWVYLKKMKQIGIELEDIAVPAWVAHSILVIGFSLLALRLALLLKAIMKGESEGFHRVSEADESLEIVESYLEPTRTGEERRR